MLDVHYRTVRWAGHTEGRVVASHIPLEVDFPSGPKIPEIGRLHEPAESHRSYSRTIWINAASRKTSDFAGRQTYDSARVRASQAGGASGSGDCGDRRRAHRESRGEIWRGGKNDADRTPHRDGTRCGGGGA